jgi:hypothetical protein
MKARRGRYTDSVAASGFHERRYSTAEEAEGVPVQAPWETLVSAGLLTASQAQDLQARLWDDGLITANDFAQPYASAKVGQALKACIPRWLEQMMPVLRGGDDIDE